MNKAAQLCALVGLAASCFAQRQIPSQIAAPGSYQDFSRAATTRPMRSGTTLPATCATGDQFFKTNATAGQNLYGCIANTWSQQAGGGGGGAAVSCAAVTPATTPTYNAASITSSGCFTVALNATAITGGTITDPSSGTGQIINLYVLQDGTGGRPFACPTGVSGCPLNFDTTANGATALTLLYLGSSAYQVTAINGQSVSATCQYYYEASTNGNNYQQICAPDSLSANTTYKFSSTAPTNGQILSASVSGSVVTIGGTAASGGSFSAGCPPSATTTMTGSDITLCTISSVSALAAGSCYTFSGLAQAAQNYQVFIYADGTLIDTPIANNNTWGGYYVGWTSLYCNGAAVQSAQTMEPLFSTFQNSALSYGIATTVVAGTNAGGYPITPTAVDWSTTHTITVKMNAASGNGRLYGFKIN